MYPKIHYELQLKETVHSSLCILNFQPDEVKFEYDGIWYRSNAFWQYEWFDGIFKVIEQSKNTWDFIPLWQKGDQ